MVAILFVVIVLTTPDGQPIWVESKHIQTIRSPDHHCAAGSAAWIKFDNGGNLCVRETPNQISDKVHSQ